MDTEWQQLATYVQRGRGADEAFAQLVHQHIRLVYSAALRQLNDAAAAEEVTQSVFILLAEKAPQLKPTGSLGGWLYNAASLKAKEHLRSDLARRRREQKAYEMAANDTPDDDALDWDRVAPLLDTAMGELHESDREAVLLRYFQKRALREVGETLGVSEEAARKRVSRAVDRLRAWFAERGVAFSCGALVASLTAHGAEAAPAHLAGATLQAVAAESTTATAAATTSTLLTTMASTKFTALAAALIGAAIPISLGYLNATTPRETELVPQPAAHDPIAIPEPRDSELIAEWKRLRAQFGPDGGSMPELYKAIKKIEDNFRRRAFQAALVAEWAATDGAGAVAFLKQNDQGMLGQLFADWLKTDPAGAIAALKSYGSELQHQIREHIVGIAEISPESLPELAAFVERRRAWDRQVEDAFASYARNDFEAARAMAEGMSSAAAAEALAGVAKAWAERDGPSALEWVQGIEDEATRGRAMQALLVGWAKLDPIAALDRIDMAPPGGNEGFYGSTTASLVMRAAAETDFDSVLAWLENQKDSVNLMNGGYDGIQPELAKRFMADVPGTLEIIFNHGARKQLEHIFGNIMLNDGFAHRDTVWAWVHAQDDPVLADRLRQNLLRSAAWKSPDAALKWIGDLTERGESDGINFDNLAQALINGGSDIGRLDGLLERIVDGPLRKALLTASVTRIDENADVATWIGRLPEFSPDARPHAVQNIASSWSLQDPVGAIAWVRELDDAAERSAAFRGLAKGWAQADSYEASEWITALPPGTERDHAIVGLVSQIAGEAPDAAWEWANSITSTEQEHEAKAAAITQTLRKDPESALAMLEESDLPADKKDSLRTAIEFQLSH